ncbi:molybdopterin oxidoreductase family protein [Immundisolibacter sp.]|uniref:molybdopterin oxidoreductase family protein n=1 Tax=Immundisolibacter sp. TaxID=1934948 RepID=UPI002B1146BD|nr:molybdopterin oxidoreductase family protein [Immundisolibacter sp.]MEA3219916.1 Sulfite dehydrogenase subunit A [Immundisolibacter sp.]
MPASDPVIDTSPVVADEIKTTTCYMCACRCGVRVHLRDGRIRYIDGNPDHPVNGGVICGKGSAGIMKQESPARLRKPLLRTGERGRGEFREIEWDEALSLLADRLAGIRNTDPRKLAFFTGRDQSQALTGWWAQQFGTPNYAAHGGFCSVNMAAGGLYSIGGSFWEFGEIDWEHTRYLVMFGVAEDHDSNPLKIGLAKLKARGAKFVSVNPVQTGYSAIADEWLAIRPGTDGLLILALVHELLRSEQVDFDYLARYTNAPWLVIDDPGAADDGLFARDGDGNPLLFDRARGQLVNALSANTQPVLAGRRTLADGRGAVPAFELLARRYLEPAYAPEAVAEQTGLSAATIRGLAAEIAQAAFEQPVVIEQPWTDWAGRRHEQMIGRPVAFYAMRGIAAHSNGFHACRALHMLQMLLGAIDTPGSFRYKPPFPRPAPPPQKPTGKPAQVRPGEPMPGLPLGFVTGPEDLLLDADGQPMRIDKAYSWEAPLAAHGAMHSVIHNAWKGDPYPIDTLFLFMSNMAWNSSMNSAGTMDMLTDRDPASGEYRIPFIVYSDAFASEMVAYSDLVLPDTTYLERWDAISLLDRPISSADCPADAIRQPIMQPDRDVRCFQSVLLDLGARLGLPGMVTHDGSPHYPGGYADYIVNHERKPGVGTLAGWRGAHGNQHGSGAANPNQLQRYIDNGCFWQDGLPPQARYFKHANRDYLDYAARMGFIDSAEPIILQIYSEVLQKFRLAARGHGPVTPPVAERARVETYFDPLPIWYAPLEEAALNGADFPLHAITQRPMIMYHAWDSQNAWQRQILGSNRLYLHPQTAGRLGVPDDGWVWVTSHHARIKCQVRLMAGVNPDTVWTWNAVGKRAGAWNLDPGAAEAKKGFLLNHLIADLLPGGGYSNSDPVTGQAAWYDLRVRVEPVAAADQEPVSAPQFAALPRPPGLDAAPGRLSRGRMFRRRSAS